jgi:tRNA nucleotidyltransferase (CCA-adding enzyme)
MLQSVKLPSYIERVGPEVFRRKESSKFISKNTKECLLFWINREMRIVGLFNTKIINAKDYVHYLFSERAGYIGITEGLKEDVRHHGLKIYTGDEKGMMKRIVRHAANEIISTERFITW